MANTNGKEHEMADARQPQKTAILNGEHNDASGAGSGSRSGSGGGSGGSGGSGRSSDSGGSGGSGSSAFSVSSKDEIDLRETRYECGICTYWLNIPVLTKCGHLFCTSCLSEWLQKKKICPVCNEVLSSDRDLFPDRLTRREIEQIRIKCPNYELGCMVTCSPVDKHIDDCPFQQSEMKCSFAAIGCKFVAHAGKKSTTIDDHLKSDVSKHMELMLVAMQQQQLATWSPEKLNDVMMASAASLSSAAHGGKNGAGAVDDQRIHELSKRIVLLEQLTFAQNAKIENLTKQIIYMRTQVDPRYSNGVIIWKINQFGAFIQQLSAKPNNPVYSHETYTSPDGYKFCARLNVQPKRDNLLSLHVHLMQSENDDYLDWPFTGRIRLYMFHPSDANLSQIDTIMTKPEILAFDKPREKISTRGFGFVEYANITDIKERGFCQNDCLVIKIQINLV